MLFKFRWILSALILKIFCNRLEMPSYFSFPIFFKGLNRVSIGKRVRIFPGSRFEVHDRGSIVIGDNVGIGQNFHITSEDELVIGANTVITANVCVTNIHHNFQDINYTNILKQRNITKKTIIGESCFIGFGSVILPGTILGKHCIVGANSVVTGEFPDYCVIAGSPAKVISKYNSKTFLWEKVNE